MLNSETSLICEGETTTHCSKSSELLDTIDSEEDEAGYDNREDADDDLTKGRIKFPINELYGRTREVKKLQEIFSSFSLNSSGCRLVFVGGYSGTGKSFLINQILDRTCATRLREKDGKRMHVMPGQFCFMNAVDPFSAISKALNNYVIQLVQKAHRGELRPLKLRLAQAGIYQGSTSAKTLIENFVPSLDRLLLRKANASGSEGRHRRPSVKKRETSPPSSGNEDHGDDLHMLRHVFQTFIKTLPTADEPLIFFMDNMQWASDTSIRLLTALLQDQGTNHIMFIGAYRSNEVDEDHRFTKMIEQLQGEKESERVSLVEIYNLSPDEITKFIADSIRRTPEEVTSISEAVYAKTLGNIFFVKQALEELVRKNVLYYDVVFFQWQFGDITSVELENLLSGDVVGMIRTKLGTLPVPLQRALAVAGFTGDHIELGILKALLLATESLDVDMKDLQEMMSLAFSEGLILHGDDPSASFHDSLLSGSSSGACYRFANELVREAARAFVPTGNTRDRFLLALSKALLEQESAYHNEWMLLTAADHLNSIPIRLTDPNEMMELNYKAGKIALCKGAFREAAKFFRAGLSRLDPPSLWKKHYMRSLDLHNSVMEAELALGNFSDVLNVAQQILQHAKSLGDMGRAHYCYIEACSSLDHSRSCDKALDILGMYGVRVPKSPTKIQVQAERVRLRLALRGRSLSCFCSFPISSSSTVNARMKIAGMALTYAISGKRSNLVQFLGAYLIRLFLRDQEVTRDLPLIFIRLGGYWRQQLKYDDALEMANISRSLIMRFPEERGREFLKAKVTLYFSLTSLLAPFRDAVEVHLGLQKLLFSQGETHYSIASGMVGLFGYLNSSCPLNRSFEYNLVVFEESAANLGRYSYAASFCLLRQWYHNLVGGVNASRNPTEVNGAVYNEDQALASLEGDARLMNNRDVSVIRLMLAVIFDDETVMEQMLHQLDELPVFDIVVARQYLRMTYMGFAALILSARKGECEKYRKWANLSFDFFRNLSDVGSRNAPPVYACLRVLKNINSIAAFDEAMEFCRNEGLLNLAALINERRAIMVLENYPNGPNNINSTNSMSSCSGAEKGALDYLKVAVWLYHEWGASGKVRWLQTRYEFLGSVFEEEVPAQVIAIKRRHEYIGTPVLREMSIKEKGSTHSSLRQRSSTTFTSSLCTVSRTEIDSSVSI